MELEKCLKLVFALWLLCYSGVYLLSLCQTKKGRRLIHLQYVEWPDFGVPHPLKFIQFLHMARDLKMMDKPGSAGPVCIHCSAGIGRSGAFLVIDSLINLVSNLNLCCVQSVFENNYWNLYLWITRFALWITLYIHPLLYPKFLCSEMISPLMAIISKGGGGKCFQDGSNLLWMMSFFSLA